jgi:hypothetical protein
MNTQREVGTLSGLQTLDRTNTSTRSMATNSSQQPSMRSNVHSELRFGKPPSKIVHTTIDNSSSSTRRVFSEPEQCISELREYCSSDVLCQKQFHSRRLILRATSNQVGHVLLPTTCSAIPFIARAEKRLTAASRMDCAVGKNLLSCRHCAIPGPRPTVVRTPKSIGLNNCSCWAVEQSTHAACKRPSPSTFAVHQSWLPA